MVNQALRAFPGTSWNLGHRGQQYHRMRGPLWEAGGERQSTVGPGPDLPGTGLEAEQGRFTPSDLLSQRTRSLPDFISCRCPVLHECSDRNSQLAWLSLMLQKKRVAFKCSRVV